METKFTFKHKNRKYSLNVKLLNNYLSQFIGLMFKKESEPLLFVFKKPRRISIHSFFCKSFVAIWFIDEKIMDIKIINPNIFSIKPKKKFNKLLEIPKNSPYFKEMVRFIDDKNI